MVGVAGYVLGDSGRRYVVVAIVNHPNANAARPALEAMADWVAADVQPVSRAAPPLSRFHGTLSATPLERSPLRTGLISSRLMARLPSESWPP